MTGASGTVGSALLPRMAAAGVEQIVAIGRRQPTELRPSDSFLPADLADSGDLQNACATLESRPPADPVTPISGLVLAAGVDSRQGVQDLTHLEWSRCLWVNAYAGIRLLATVAQMPATGTLPVVVWSSDVVATSEANTAVYAASKAALEVGIRHTTADLPAPGIAALLIRLPDIGVPMATSRGRQHRPSASSALERAIKAATDFITTNHPRGHVEVWTDA